MLCVVQLPQTCKRWLADECTHTDESCKYLHVPSICRAFQRGTCPKGAACTFIHDKQDREHYRHGRAYCQKTAVHADATPATASKQPTQSQSSKPVGSVAPKDSLDSILSGLGSWKIAPAKKSAGDDLESDHQLSVHRQHAYLDDDADDGVLADAAAAHDQQQQEHERDLLEEAQEFEQDQQATQGVVFDEEGGATFDHNPGGQSYLNGLSFDLAPGVGVGSAQQQWYDSTGSGVNVGVGFDDDASGGGMFFPNQASAGFQSQSNAQQQQSDEFPWFMQFRQAIVQPAMQAMHAREQQQHQKMIGPD